MASPKVKSKSSKRKVQVIEGQAHIKSTFNNTHVTITDLNGNKLCGSCAGRHGFKGHKKGTPFAAQEVAQSVAEMAKNDHGMQRVEVIIKGPGAGGESAARALNAVGMQITKVSNKTSIPHNGCRPRKKRRV